MTNPGRTPVVGRNSPTIIGMSETFRAVISVKLKMAVGAGTVGEESGEGREPAAHANVLRANAEFEPPEIQDLADVVPRLLELRARSNVDIRFFVRVELGDSTSTPEQMIVAEVNNLFDTVKADFQTRYPPRDGVQSGVRYRGPGQRSP